MVAPGGSVTLNSGVVYGAFTVFNRSGVALSVYPSHGTQIEANGVGTAVQIANGGVATFTINHTLGAWRVS